MNENQLSAVISFVYNVGIGAYHDSTLLKLLNQGDVQDAADQFMKWNKAGGQPLKGLTNRRSAERDLFLKPAFEPLTYNDPATELDKLK
jgi:GH24 family phage-related lysozyme (muramidase)